MLQGQQNVEITKKELSELSHITDEALKQKVIECMYIGEENLQ